MKRRRRRETWKLFAVLMVACAALLGVFIFRDFAGEKESAAAFDEVKSAVFSQADLSAMKEADEQMVKRLYGLNPADYEGFSLYYPSTNMGAEELLLVKLRDTSQMEDLKAAAENRVAAQKNSFEGYGVSQTELLSNSVLDARGNYLLLAVAENAEALRRAFLQAL